MYDNAPPAHDEANALPTLDARLIQWMAVQALQDCYARLADGGADIEARIELSSLFIDLPVLAPCRSDRTLEPVEIEQRAMPWLLGGRATQVDEDSRVSFMPGDGRLRWLLVGGPGSGKSTLTTMVAQQLRRPWIDRQVGVLIAPVLDAWQRTRSGLMQLIVEGWDSQPGTFPIRVSLPKLARWMASPGKGPSLSLWDYLAARLVNDLAGKGISTEVSASELRELALQAPKIFWILDGLDEVPATAGRGRVIEVVRFTLCDAARTRDGVLVSTRPQGYDGEFDDLEAIELLPLPAPLALKYGERLLTAWLVSGASFDLEERREWMHREFAKPEVADLVQTPLHTTMAALLVASRGSLPPARSQLFEEYFEMVLRRELGKPFDHGIQDRDKGVLLALHARAGLALQVRSQAQIGARSSLRRRELREMLAAIYAELGARDDDLRTNVDRIMRFAADRLVLLLHSSEGEYEFGVRSLQEYFAALALVEGQTAVVRARLDAIALDPHWSNVLAFVVSSSALKTGKDDRERALLFTVSLCRSLNAGDCGEVAARCFLGSRFAIAMLRETERYGHRWLHDPLWEVALAAAASPTQRNFGLLAGTGKPCRRTGAWTDDVELHARLGWLAGRWRGSDAEIRQQQVIRAAKASLARGGDEALNGWRGLHGLLLSERPEAIAVAESHAPNTCEDARDVCQALFLESGLPPPPWIVRFVTQHPEWFPPGWASFGFMDDATTILRRFVEGTSQIFLWWGTDVWAGRIFSLDTDVLNWRDLARDISAMTPAWALWEQVARFLAEPSQSSLADVLDRAGAEDALSDLRAWDWGREWLSWPLHACVAHARSSAELLAISVDIRAGRLGTIDDWRAAEARWRNSPHISLDEVGFWLDAEGPWNSDIALRGMIVFRLHLELLSDGSASEVVSRLFARIEMRPVSLRRVALLLRPILTGDSAIPLRVAQYLERERDEPAMRFRVSELLPDLGGPDAEGWFALLDERGRVGLNHPDFALHDDRRAVCVTRIMVALLARLRERPDQWGLIDAVASLLHTLPDTDLSALTIPALPADAPPRAVATHSLLTLLSGRFESSELPVLIGRLRVDDDNARFDAREQLALILRGRSSEQAGTLPLLIAMLDAQPGPREQGREALLGTLFAVHRRSLSAAFASAAAWKAQDLPEPFLAGFASPRTPTRLVRIVELSNIRLFRETPLVDVPFVQPGGEYGQWLVLVGENGVGKTTLLRALGLTLASPTIASKLLDERLPMLRNGSEGRVSIELDAGPLSIALRRGERTEEVVESLAPEDAVRPWVVGYGVRRGNARGEKDREAEVGAIGELHTLFDRPASLHSAVQWLRELDADVLREQRRTSRGGDLAPGPREQVWQSVQHALQVLLGVTKVEVDDGGAVYVWHPQFDRVRLDALSDGYLTTAGWVIDMVARWIDRQHEIDEPVGADLLHQMCGFVLIDEIDLHLHPMWQMRIIEDVRRLFPRLSFVVTTHNPLTLQGARRGEVYVMRRNGAGIELMQRDIRPGHDVDRVLFDHFGVEHTFDRETRELLALHRQMIERGVAAGDTERAKVEAQLNRRFGEVGGILGRERAGVGGPVVPPSPEERLKMASFFLKKKR